MHKKKKKSLKVRRRSFIFNGYMSVSKSMMSNIASETQELDWLGQTERWEGVNVHLSHWLWIILFNPVSLWIHWMDITQISNKSPARWFPVEETCWFCWRTDQSVGMMWLEAVVAKVISYCRWHPQHRKNTVALQQTAGGWLKSSRV